MMRFLVDECIGPVVARWLADQGHDVYSVYDEARGADDEVVLATAVSESRILITNDKDFGEKVYRDQLLHAGVVLLRLSDQNPRAEIEAVSRLLAAHSDRLGGSFVVVTDSHIRFGRAWRLTLDQ